MERILGDGVNVATRLEALYYAARLSIEWEIEAVTLVGMVLVLAGILVSIGVFVVTYKIVNRLSQGDVNGNGNENQGRS